MKKCFTILVILFCYGKGYSQPANTNLSSGVAFDGEPYVAINPKNPQNLVAAWMGLKFANGQLHIAIKTRATFDGGTTWSVANALPHFGTTFGSADVSMAFDKNGLLYISYVDYRQSPDSGGVYVGRSFDGGLHWDTPTEAFDMYDVPAKRPGDRPWMVVDHSNTAHSGTLYITTKPAPWIPAPNRNYYKVSTDSGHHWSAIANVDGGNYLVGNIIAAPMAAPATTVNGNFCAVYPSYLASQNVLPAYYLATSKNQGQTFTYSTVISANVAVSDTNFKNGYRLISHPTDSNKMAFVVPVALYGDADIIAIHSNDGGQTWSTPVRVNDDATGNGKAQDMVWAAYNEQGNLVVTWRDRRNSNTNGFWNAGYDFYYATSTDNGQTFGANQKLSSQFIAFDSIISQSGNDFMSCVYHNDTLSTVWGDTRSGKMNIYFAKTIASTNTTVGFSLLEGEEPTLKLFPNPASNALHISLSQQLVGKTVAIFGLNGERVYSTTASSTDMSLDIQKLQRGVYFLKIGGEMKRWVKE